jgi:hypothetical protein
MGVYTGAGGEAMDWYDDADNVETYARMADGYDGRDLVERLAAWVPPDAAVLELGMGLGKDLDLLAERYRATGSDRSAVFLDRYRAGHPYADLLRLDAVSIGTDRRFDAIYSNKVLHHLDRHRLERSFLRQREILVPRGLALHSFWYGNEIERYGELVSFQVTEPDIESLVAGRFTILEMERYAEMEPEDSLYVLLRRLP